MIQKIADGTGKEITSDVIWREFDVNIWRRGGSSSSITPLSLRPRAAGGSRRA